MSTIAILAFFLTYLTLGASNPITWALLVATFTALTFDTRSLIASRKAHQ
ncbi:hypothetical protein [Corynebacterium belfantii]|nr:hypothetical protein [Corynebacterium belfantii]SPJ39418.1 hypothetical protein CHUV2995_00193 [Corynebacterium diphtheriae subsp. lausannense]STC65584.1 Uncharacterised protein [Corynebacterium diphtheriae]MBG9260270.1 hypothetical protein [Corynebacterium belfantii]MBG9267019.1 hypothetical protein [Corynebacterium belfantii]MBG9287069.1 hypothetical protein [Corynebacterium belfantii]